MDYLSGFPQWTHSLSRHAQWTPSVDSLSGLVQWTPSVDTLMDFFNGLAQWPASVYSQWTLSVNSLRGFSVNFLSDALGHARWNPTVTCTVDFQGGISQWTCLDSLGDSVSHLMGSFSGLS